MKTYYVLMNDMEHLLFLRYKLKMIDIFKGNKISTNYGYGYHMVVLKGNEGLAMKNYINFILERPIVREEKHKILWSIKRQRKLVTSPEEIGDFEF